MTAPPTLLHPRRTYARRLARAPDGMRCWMCGDVYPKPATHVHCHGDGRMPLCGWHAQRVASECQVEVP